MQTIRYGIVGTNNIARSTHIPCIKRLPGAVITAVCDIDPDARRSGQADSGAAQVFARAEDLFACADVDAVVIATPNDTHCELVLDACRHRKHILCEKPMATSARDCDRMIRAVDEAGVVLEIAQPYRYSPFYRGMKAMIERGAIGAPQMAWAKEFMKWGDVEPSDRHWRQYQKRSGGALVEKNCHHLDLLTWMLGAKPVRVCAFGGKNVFQKPEIIDNATLICEYANGSRAMLLLSLFLSKHMIDLEVGVAGVTGRIETFDQGELYLYKHADDHLKERLHAAGWAEDRIRQEWAMLIDPQVAARADFRALNSAEQQVVREANALWLRHCKTKRPDNTAPVLRPDEEGFHSGVMTMHEDFIECVRTGGRPFCDARVGKDSILIGLAGEQSIREGRVVPIADVP